MAPVRRLGSSAIVPLAFAVLASFVVGAAMEPDTPPTDPGRYLRRADLLGSAQPPTDSGMEGRQALLTFTHLTDIHLIDEESPLRTEFLDSMLGTAYRPQEGFGPQVLAWMAHLSRTIRSAYTGRPSELAITTGDSSDNSQHNEVRWLIDILDGGPVDPDSGDPGTCGLRDDARRYDGVAHGVPDGLLDLMNRPFLSEGIGQPWYAAFGNHDGLVAGNVPLRPGMAALATGCRKVLELPPQDIASISDAGQAHGRDGLLLDAMDEMARHVAQGAVDPAAVRVVLSDADRRPLTRAEYIREHLDTTGTPVGHGFGDRNLASGDAWYAFSPAPGIRFLVLDTVAPTGGHNGAIVDEQFRWIHDELTQAEARHELVLAFGHHTLRTITERADTVFAERGSALPTVHHGWSDGGIADCAAWDAAAAVTPTESLGCLFLRHPGLIAYIDGHEHRNLAGPVARPKATGIPGGFWEITTASHIDWPQEARLLEVIDNRDGSLSIVATSFGLPATPDDTMGAEGSVERSAAIAHQLAYDDPQGSTGRDGGPSAAGDPHDRDVELLVPHPFREIR